MLRRVIAEFDRTDRVTYDTAEYTGHDGLRSTVRSFADGWDIGRGKLRDNLHFLSEAIDSILETFRDLDGQLAGSMSGLTGSLARVDSEGHSSATALGVIPASVDASDPDAVAIWWSSLTPEEQAQSTSRSSSTVANLNGVPFADRVTAHQSWAQQRHADRSLSADERAYLERVSDGSVQLVVYDPQQDRIVEAIGDLSAPASQVVTYVPGTDANLEGFYTGDTQQVGRYVENKVDGTVVFVYKDGPWAEWGLGGRDNALPNSDYVRDRGADLARFQQSMSREPNVSNASTVAISHSWGTTAMASSEVAGAQHDSVISLSGAYLPDQRQAQPGTRYHYLRHDVDALTNAERVGGRRRTLGGGNLRYSTVGRCRCSIPEWSWAMGLTITVVSPADQKTTKMPSGIWSK